MPEINKVAWHELSKLSGNLNQLCKQLNTFGALNNPDELSEIIQSLRLALLGVKESVDPKAQGNPEASRS
ncbi:MAG: plasmid mobilization relaxosome protein MobC [Dechloromonas sp.]|uniref:Plasmid mobilization relaxosome protein MobC n=1 Tax=Candidatus Dechloromonas phosphorivorans TaxID=2899244 RepID=A0A935N1R1_9RHOO|nr:plasmid mobilization relaxosome protein MobC [Candidatus Dechloromonas phosphorivorans]